METLSSRGIGQNGRSGDIDRLSASLEIDFDTSPLPRLEVGDGVRAGLRWSAENIGTILAVSGILTRNRLMVGVGMGYLGFRAAKETVRAVNEISHFLDDIYLSGFHD